MTTAELTQAQREAVVEVLVLAMCVDGHFSLAEEESIQDKIRRLGWEGEHALRMHVQRAIARARETVESGEEVRGFLEGRAAVLGSRAACRLAYNMARRLLCSDGVEREESRLSEQMRAAFGL